MTETPENRGGKRPNSGRKKLDSAEQLERIEARKLQPKTKALFRRVPVEIYEELEKLVDSFIKFARKNK